MIQIKQRPLLHLSLQFSKSCIYQLWPLLLAWADALASRTSHLCACLLLPSASQSAWGSQWYILANPPCARFLLLSFFPIAGPGCPNNRKRANVERCLPAWKRTPVDGHQHCPRVRWRHHAQKLLCQPCRGAGFCKNLLNSDCCMFWAVGLLQSSAGQRCLLFLGNVLAYLHFSKNFFFISAETV